MFSPLQSSHFVGRPVGNAFVVRACEKRWLPVLEPEPEEAFMFVGKGTPTPQDSVLREAQPASSK
jgi:hypothetical protein